MKIGDEVYIHGYVDEIRKDTVIIRNEGGYFGTMPSEIKVLEQEPKTDVLDKIRTEIVELRNKQNVGVLECLDIIDKYREQEPKTGDWIRCGDSSYIYECSECKDTVWANKDADRTWKCCPNCEARMEGSE